MFRNERKTGKTVVKRTAAAAVFMFAMGSTLADEAAPSAYTMAVIKNEAFGQTVMSGEYAKGIAKINSYSSKRAATFAAKNNLCVAYTLARKFDQAESACEAALSLSERHGRYVGSPLNPDGSRDLALAFSNRGVFRAVTGDTEGAMQDFENAAKVNSDLVAAGGNLARLKAKEATAMSSI